jgi:hypothetical protein
MWVNLQAVGL